MSLFGDIDFGRLARDIAAPIVNEVRALRMSQRGHFPDIDSDEPFEQFGTVSVPVDAVGVEVLTIPDRKKHRGVVTSLANVLDGSATESAWDDGTGLTGLFFQVRVGGRVLPGFARMRAPFGFIGARGKTFIPFSTSSAFQLWAINRGAVALTVCGQVAGHWLGDKLGTSLEGIGPQLASGLSGRG